MRLLLAFLLFLTCLISNSSLAKAQANTSIAILFEDSQSEALSKDLFKELSQNSFTIQEQALTQTICQNLKFPNRMNLSCKEARNLGQALGVDIILILQSKVIERADVGANLYGEGYLALTFASTRSGKLILFDFIETKQANLNLTSETLAKELTTKIPNYSQQILSFLANQLKPPKLDLQDAEAIEIPNEGTPLAKNFDLPEVLTRKQPIYTETARKLTFSAVVELEVVLRKDGMVGNIEVVRWAGFGLDESAITAAKQLQFEPALLNGNPISCRALIRYNFNYKNQK